MRVFDDTILPCSSRRVDTNPIGRRHLIERLTSRVKTTTDRTPTNLDP